MSRRTIKQPIEIILMTAKYCNLGCIHTVLDYHNVYTKLLMKMHIYYKTYVIVCATISYLIVVNSVLTCSRFLYPLSHQKKRCKYLTNMLRTVIHPSHSQNKLDCIYTCINFLI